MASAAAAARSGRRGVTRRQGAQGGAWRPATAASRRHFAALTVPPFRAGVWPLVVGARSARTRAPQRVVAAITITAIWGGRGRRGRCRPHPPLWLTTATGARHPPAGDAAANSRAARGAVAGGQLGVRAGGGEGRAPVCIRGDSGASARGGGASDGTGMRVTTRETCRPGLMPPLPRPPVGRHQPATVHRHCGGRRHRRAAAAAARSTARVAAGGGRSGVGSPGVSGGFYFFVTLALPRHLGVACPEVLIALRAFFKGGGAAVPWSAIDLVQRIRIRERNVIPYLPVEARNRPVTSCSTFSL